MDARTDTSTGTRAVTRVREFVRVSGGRGSSPMNRPAQKDAGATTHSLEGTPISVDAKLQKQSSSENSICGGQPQQALEVPEAVFPAIRREDCAGASRSIPRRGTM
ncbi:uncharacterized protein LOC142817438 [Rhipicephalus microplus]|uniref:uncharacterized protein LOC142817438 n=1 Tax=Rhipicephalus microplus TaxID=6941 RepID=UPI003F6A9DEA